MSTTDKHEVRRLAALAAERGVATLEAPVTGGVHLAATGEITVIVGGDAARRRDAHAPVPLDGTARSSTSGRSAAPPTSR